ncbi:hypothetical protein [uncultured Hydrogenophaga sp.]|uniref:DUF7673 family protein n=1 Tax=uncultured Hydrogenophaga sp. TaxID=199683 RepID=UPI00258E8CAE|nr:hypothetical protein [uncultured Hydrogenophaga sp.]
MRPWHPTAEQLDALAKLWQLGQGDSSGEKAAAKLLLGLYNGRRFPFDLTDLRLLDEANLARALLVLEMDARPRQEVHELLGMIFQHPRGHFGDEFEWRAYELRLKGRTKKAFLPERARLCPVERV